MLASMSSYELTAWQMFLVWKQKDEKKRAKEREFAGEDD